MSKRAIFRNPGLLYSCLVRPMIGPENSHHSLNQSDAKLKPVTTSSSAFSRALGSLLVLP